MNLTFDSELLWRRRARAHALRAEGAGFLLDHATRDLLERLSTVERRFTSAATLFCAGGAVADALLASSRVGSVIRVEADPAFADGETLLVAPEVVGLGAASVDLAVSLLALQDINDIPGVLAQIRRALMPDGLFLAALAGQGTLAELRECLLAAETGLYGGVSPRVSPFVDVRDAGGLLQRAGFALPVTDLETVTVRYDDMFGLLRDLRAMGATNVLVARSRKPVSRRFFLRAAEIYADRYSDPDGRIRATFSFIWLSGWAPHESQQQPLKPGSAAVSLKRILGDGG